MAFDFGAEVQLKTDPDIKLIVTGWNIRPSGKMYECACGVETSWHQDIELEKFPEVKRVGGFKSNSK